MNKVQRAVLMTIFFANLPISVSHIEQLLGKCVSQAKIREVLETQVEPDNVNTSLSAEGYVISIDVFSKDRRIVGEPLAPVINNEYQYSTKLYRINKEKEKDVLVEYCKSKKDDENLFIKKGYENLEELIKTLNGYKNPEIEALTRYARAIRK